MTSHFQRVATTGVDPPSTQLVQLLTSLGLCTSGDLRRCRPRVRRLARDIPTFDTVWIDALVQNRALTTFQAAMLATQQPDALAVGPFLLIERLGGDGRFTYYRARRRDDRRPILLTSIDQDPETTGAALHRLQALVEVLRGFNHRGVCPIQEFSEQNGRLVVAGPWVAGSNLQELAVRRGRFPADVVTAILRQIVPGLQALEQRGVPHGDLRLRNIRLMQSGDAMLVRPGLLAALTPEISIHSRLPHDAYDTLAPERIDSGLPANSRSDLYALGCVMWQLLTGRPPWPHGDPLAKLAAHQSRRIPDVRDWSPDTPEPLAKLVWHLTDPDPAQRSAGVQWLTAVCPGSLRRSRRRLAQFCTTLDVPAGPLHPAESRPATRTIRVATGTAALLMLSVCLVHAGARTELLNIAHQLTGRLQRPPAGTESHPAEQSSTSGEGELSTGLLPLPSPDADGVIELDGAQTYEATEIAAVGGLTIRCSDTEPALIVVRDRPLRIWAERAVLDNVAICSNVTNASSPSAANSTEGLLVVDAQELAMRRCVLHCGETSPESAVVWSALDPASAAPQRLLVRDSLFLGPADALRIESAASSVKLDNVLKTDGGTLLDLRRGALDSPRPFAATLRQVTLRKAGGLVRLMWDGEPMPLRSLEFTLQDCVFDIAAPDGALLQFAAPTLPDDWPLHIQIGGEGSVLGSTTQIAGHRSAVGEDAILPLDAGLLSIEGLQFADFAFAGADAAAPGQSLAVGQFGYRRSSKPPGIDPDALPRMPLHAYNSSTTNADGAWQATR